MAILFLSVVRLLSHRTALGICFERCCGDTNYMICSGCLSDESKNKNVLSCLYAFNRGIVGILITVNCCKNMLMTYSFKCGFWSVTFLIEGFFFV